jgi:hypothetical protein
MFAQYKENKRRKALQRWVTKMERDYNKMYEITNDDGAHVFEANYKRKRDR